MKINKKALGFVLVPLVLAGSVAALWISNAINLNGIFTSTTGTPPEAIFYTDTISMAAGETKTFTHTYTNPDGTALYGFALTDNINSTNSLCKKEIGKDIIYKLNGIPLNATNVNLTMTSGENVINTTITVDSQACPLNGYYSINGTLIG